MLYRFVIDVDWSEDRPLSDFTKQLSYLRARVVKGVALDLPELPRLAVNVSKRDRNLEIITKYSSDPKKFSTGALAEMYGISKERVCQILRTVNAIGKAQARKELAREALADSKAEAAKELEALYEKVVDYVRAGMSIRKACAAVGQPMHGQFATVVGAKVRVAGIRRRYGPHGRAEEFAERKRRVEALLREGWAVKAIIDKLRAEGETINSVWVYTNFPKPRKNFGPPLS